MGSYSTKAANEKTNKQKSTQKLQHKKEQHWKVVISTRRRKPRHQIKQNCQDGEVRRSGADGGGEEGVYQRSLKVTTCRVTLHVIC